MKPRKKANTPLEQIYFNTIDIEKLKQQIAPLYKCETELTDETTSVARNLTNVSEEIETGFLIDPIGNVFKINGNDNYSLLLEFYTNLKGEQGEQGPQGEDGTDGQDGAQGARGFSFRLLVSGTISGTNNFNLSDITPQTNIQVSDLIIDTLGNIGEVSAVNGTTITIVEQANIIKPMYEHNIKLYRGGFDYVCFFKIINNDPTPYSENNINDLFTYLTNNFKFSTSNYDMTDNNFSYNVLQASGRDMNSGLVVVGVGYSINNNTVSMLMYNISSNNWSARQLDTLPNVRDKVIKLN